MASALKNLSQSVTRVPSAETMSFGIVVSEWNIQITSKLLEGAYNTLLKAGCTPENISVKWVPGAFELPLAVQYFVELTTVDAVIALGCVIQGETRHFDFICDAVSHALIKIQLKEAMPVAFGLLTTDNLQQAIDRTGGKHGNKGDEAAITAIKMVELGRQMETESFDNAKQIAVN